MIKTDLFTLRKTTPIGDLKVSENYKNNEEAIIIDFGKLDRNSEAVVAFEYESKTHDIIDLRYDCGCTNNSSYKKLEDGKFQIVLKYNTSRIGVQDRGTFEKAIQLILTNGENIFFKLRISEKNSF